MGMLDRIKKRQLDGFKEFVQNMETTAAVGRQQIFLTGILEDPIFMGWVTKNIKNFEDFLTLPTSEIEAVLNYQDQILSVFTKCLSGWPQEKIKELESIVPRHFSRIRDELSYIKEIPAGERESAVFFILKSVRKLQAEERIHAFQWRLPPMEIFYPKQYSDGKTEIIFESGITAAQGSIEKGKRSGAWRHFYDTGRLLAEGEYVEGLKSGTWTMFYTNGSIKAQGAFHLDLKDGQWKEWDRTGKVTDSDYVNGTKTVHSSSN